MTVAIRMIWIVLSIAIARIVLTSEECVAQDWRQFGGPDGNFRLRSAYVEKDSQESITPWSQPLQAGDAAPVVSADRVVVSEAAFTDDGLDAHAIHCFHLRTGERLWRKVVPEPSYASQDISDRYPVRPLASSAISGDKVFVLGFGGSLRCFKLDSGEMLWQKDLVADFGATPLQFGFASSPWCDEHQVIVACGGTSALILSLSQDQGQLLWKLGSGELGYGGLCRLLPSPQTDQRADEATASLAYMARDEVIAFDSQTGTLQWSYPLPDPRLTNAVTPLAMPGSRLLIGGQGADGCILLDYSQANSTTPPSVLWRNRKALPFYCNWLTNPRATQAIGSGELMIVLGLTDGEIASKKRGWTDANFVLSGDTLVGVRGDGMAATARWDEERVVVESVQWVVNDRVWAPPVLVGQRLLVRGRNSLNCIDWKNFPQATTLPSGTAIDAMSAMYGTLHESIEALRQQANTSPGEMTYEDFEAVAKDRSVYFGEGDFTNILDSLERGGNLELAERIAVAWTTREPFSLPAFERLLAIKRRSGEADAVERMLNERVVTVEFSVTVPDTTPHDAQVYITGNSASLANWEPQGLKLERQESGVYTGRTQIPRGDLQFKCTLGSWEQEEKRADGRSISNRRRRIGVPCQVDVQVAAWARTSP